jgi:hypothetical protein
MNTKRRNKILYRGGIYILPGLLFAAGIFPRGLSAEPDFSIMVRENSTAQTLSRDYLSKPGDWEKVVEYNSLLKPGRVIQVPPDLVTKEGKAYFAEVCCGDKVRVKPAGSEISISARPGLIIEKGDFISTGLNAGAEIILSNGDKALIRQMTSLTFDPYSDPDDKPINLLRVFQGTVISLINKSKTRDVRYRIQTPTAVSLVRGTKFRTKVSDTGETRFEVLEGAVQLEADDEEILLEENFGVVIPASTGDK